MGTFTHKLQIGNPSRERFETIDALVDTGAFYSFFPRPLLLSLGHIPTLKRRVELADGTIREYDAAEVPVRINGETLGTLCLFGEAKPGSLLGALTLESFGLAADPVNKQLIPVVGLAKNIPGPD